MKLKNSILILSAILCINLYAQPVKGISAKIGFSLLESGYSYNNETINRLYHSDPFYRFAYIGLSGEFYYTKHFSTVIEAGFRTRTITYEYDKLNNMGQSTGVDELKNSVSYVAFTAYEKLHYDIRSISVYGFLGLRYEAKAKDNLDKDFIFLKESKRNILGFTSGTGFTAQSRKFRFIAELYYDGDLNNMYEADSNGSGKIRLNEFGFRIGLGFYSPLK